jgi:MarR family transcriptional regulator, 2-MHQ and catechol-resistance regulon repressor
MATLSQAKTLDDERITQFGLFIEAGRRINRLMEVSLRDQHGMTSVDFEAMLRLGRSPERRMSMSQLADQMVLTSGGVTRLIDRLSGAGLVARLSCPSDRRVQWAQLTDQGVARVAEILESHLDDLDRHFFSAMSPEEKDVLLPVLDRLREKCVED